MQKIPVSCYIRTCNEERLIGEVLQSIEDLFDEIVVVDSGSTDKTIEIINKYNVTLIEQEWLGYGYQKRFAEDKCKNEWLFALDADEILTKELKTSLRNLFKQEKLAHNIYYIDTKLIMPTGKIFNISYKDKYPRLYNKNYYRNPEHKFYDTIDVKKNEVGSIKGYMLHNTFQSYFHFIDKYNKRSTQQLLDDKKRNKFILILRIFFGFPFYFFKKYILKLLILEGVDGFIFAFIVALSRWIRDIKMWEYMQNNKWKKQK